MDENNEMKVEKEPENTELKGEEARTVTVPGVAEMPDKELEAENLQEAVKVILKGFLKELGEDIEDINQHVNISFDDDINNVSNVAKYKDDFMTDILEKLQMVAKDESVEASIRSKASRVRETIRISRESYLLAHPEKMSVIQKAKFNADASNKKGLKGAFQIITHGIIPAKKLSLEELKELTDLMITTQKEAGMYHCVGNPRAEEEYFKHELNRFAKMNDNGLCGMLRNNIKNLKDPEQRAKTVHDLQYAGFDRYSNFSDICRDKYKDIDIEQKNEDQKNDTELFIKPTLEEVKAYAAERGRPDFDAEKYIQYNDDRQWKDKKGVQFHDWKKNVDFWISNQDKTFETNIQKSNEGKQSFEKNAEKQPEYERPTLFQFREFTKTLAYVGDSTYHKLNGQNWLSSKGEPIENWKSYISRMNEANGKKFEPDGILTKEGFDMIVKVKGLNHVSAIDYKEVVEKAKQTEGKTDYYAELVKKNKENVKKEEQQQSQSSGMKMQ